MLKYESVNLEKKYKIKKIRYPISVYMKITTECMLKCDFCSQKCSVENKINNEMDFEKIKKILNNLRKIGVANIYYTGGEPLMHRNIKDILEYGYKMGFKQFLVTNGVLFNNKDNIELTKYLIGLGVSLHGKAEIHNKVVGNIDCFDTIVSNLREIKKNNENILININCTATNYNISKDNFEYIAKICKENDWKFTIARLNYIGNGLKFEKIDINNMLEIISELNEKEYNINISNCIAPCTVNKKFINLTHGCGAGQTIAAIETNGDVKICASSNLAIGNLNKKSFQRVWKSYKLKQFRKLKWIPVECKECKYFTICKGGCKAELTGDFWKKSCDATLKNYNNKVWDKIEDNKVNLSFNTVRREKFDRYIIIGPVNKVCNKKTLKVIKKIDGTKTAKEIANRDENVKELLINLKKDNLLFVDE